MSDRERGEDSRRAALLGAAGLLAACLLAYLPVLDAGFIWDDDAYVTENETLHTPSGLARIWLEPSSLPQYYPAVHTSFWLEYRIWGLAPLGYHLVNVVLHALAAWLLWRVLARLGVPGAALAAALFALHPVQVESVAWVTERKNVLSGVFYLAAAACYLRFEVPEAPGAPRNARPYAWTGLLFLLALLSKSVTASLPAALGVALWWHRGRLDRRTLLPLLPLLALGAGAGLATAWLEATHVGASGEEWALSGWERALVAGRALWFYLGKLVWPHPLSFVYPRWEIDAGDWLQWLFPVSALALAAGLLLLRRRIGRGPLAAALFFAGTLFPALGFLNVYPHRFSWVADHFQYLASIGPLALAAALAAAATARWPRPAAALAAAALLAAAGVRTAAQARTYRDAESVWRATLVHNPRSFLANTSLGNILQRRGELGAAMPHYEAAVAARPTDLVSVNNLAWALATAEPLSLRDGSRAVALAEQAARGTQHGSAAILETLAAAYAEVGRFGDAVRTAERGIAVARIQGDAATRRALERELPGYRRARPYGAWRRNTSR